MVANPVGAIVDRDGKLHCGNQRIPTGETHVCELIRQVPEKLRTVSGGIDTARKTVRISEANTTISLVVTNQKLDYAQLQRLAVQVHSSMDRAIHPFATVNDGDVLFAASTGEVDNVDLHPSDLGLVASELMWDAILAIVPDIDPVVARSILTAPTATLGGTYSITDSLRLHVAIDQQTAALRNVGSNSIFNLAPGEAIAGRILDGKAFATDSLHLLDFGFARDDGALVLNPGPWQQAALRDDAATP